jgi:methylmalonyl-CoA/ethylmalonyl-CoA epimerase
MAKVKNVNHVAIAVPDIEEALRFWEDALGLELDHIEEVSTQKSKVAFITVGDSEVELIEPETLDSSLAKFISEKGPGMHHLCLEVDDLDEMIVELKKKGIRLINEIPDILPGRKIIFIHPKASGGVLIELFQISD